MGRKKSRLGDLLQCLLDSIITPVILGFIC